MAVRMGVGNPSSKIMIVGEAFGEEEARKGEPFVGRSGEELNHMLNDAGILRSECYVTNLVNARPPANKLETWIPTAKSRITGDMVPLRGRFVSPIVAEGYASLRLEIGLVKPSLLLALGGSALWALTGHSGITKWRGSLLYLDGLESGTRVVPTYHPAAILRQWDWRKIAIHDLQRAKRELTRGNTPAPEYRFIIKPSFETVCDYLEGLILWASALHDPLWLDFDIETAGGHIRCFALTWSETDGICIPLTTAARWSGYFTLEEETHVIWLTYRLLTHPNVRLRGQNLLYDFQYVYRHWLFIPNLGQDTMLSQHVLWAGMPKSLAFQASMYARFYVYWKDLAKHNELKEGE